MDAVGTEEAKPNIEAKWDYALKAAFPNPSDREGVIPPDLGLQQEVLTRLIQHDYKEWNVPTASGPSTDVAAAAIPEKGANSLALILSTVQQVLGIEFCPLLPDVGKSCLCTCRNVHARVHSRLAHMFSAIYSRNLIDAHARKLRLCHNPRDDQRYVAFPPAVPKGLLFVVPVVCILRGKTVSNDL